MKKFNRIYIEISNICNLQCSFCPIVERDKQIMSTDTFENVLKKVAPHTKEITLHLMGEPLAHPEFLSILEIASKYFELYGVQINLTTNGILLNRYRNELIKSKAIRQINFSIHSFKDNFKDKDITPYLNDILDFSKESQEKRDDLYINYRLWNILKTDTQEESNLPIILKMASFFKVEIDPKIDVSSIKSKRIFQKIYFHFDSRFNWPSLNYPQVSTTGRCHGLTGHIGIHANGDLVPCCLDKEAVINLGNVATLNLEEIIASDRAQKMILGFSQNKLAEKLCQHCDYIKRFQ